jgi:arylsulfatase A-like enzyme
MWDMSTLSRRAFSSVLGSLPFAATGAAGPPNVLLIMSDDQGYGDFSSHGNKDIRTPELDRLRSESVRFTDFHACPMCTPTRAQLMTGRDCLFTRATNVSSGRTLLRRDIPTMADVFSENGYQTGIFGKWHLGDNYPYRPQDRGFQESVWFPSSHIGAVPDAWNNNYFNDSYRHNGRMQKYDGYCTDVFFFEAMQWMGAKHKRGERFFAYLPLNAPHGPLFVPPAFIEPYKHLPERLARFYGMIANLDANIGKMEKGLRELGIRDNTIVIFLTDNGGTAGVQQFNSGMRGNKTTLYEGGHRVPMSVRWPNGKIGGGKDVEELTTLQDVLPTLIDLCGLKVKKGVQFDGSSLGGLLQERSKQLKDRTLVIQFSRTNAGKPKKDDAAVLWKKWRLVHGKELYDLSEDREQKTNLIGQQKQVAERLQRHYDSWWKNVEPLLDQFLPVHIGSDRENPVMLSACEWADVFLDQAAQVRRGEKKNGVWHVQVERAGTYTVGLARWPREANAAISAGLPEQRHEDGVFPAGVALPIAKARLRLGSFDQTISVAATDREAVFKMTLPVGPMTMQSWFLDDSASEMLGAYYAYVERT